MHDHAPDGRPPIEAVDGARQVRRARFETHDRVGCQRVAFEGNSHLVLDGGCVRRCDEVFDRGLALTAHQYAPARVQKILSRHVDRLYGSPEFAKHR